MSENKKFKVGDVVMLVGDLQKKMTVTQILPEEKVSCVWMVESGHMAGHNLHENALVSVEKVQKEKEMAQEISKITTENRELRRMVEGYKELKADLEKQIGKMRNEYEYCIKKRDEAYEGWRVESILRCEYEDRLVELGDLEPSQNRDNITREEWKKIKKAERINMNYKDVLNEPNLPEGIK